MGSGRPRAPSGTCEGLQGNETLYIKDNSEAIGDTESQSPHPQGPILPGIDVGGLVRGGTNV
jgi:hypothetical protein